MNIKKTAFYGSFLAVAIILSYIEHLIPLPFPVGMKIGFTNIVTVFLLYSDHSRGAAVVAILRVLIINLLFGSITGFLFGFSGAIISLIAMLILKNTKLFSVVSVSAVGGVVHNLAQVVLCIIITETSAVISYLAILIPVGLIAGILIGFITNSLLKTKIMSDLTKP